VFGLRVGLRVAAALAILRAWLPRRAMIASFAAPITLSFGSHWMASVSA